MLSLIIADDEPMIVKGIQKLIDWSSLGMEIVATCHDGNSAFSAIVSKRPDLAILDISMPGKTGIDIIKEISALGLETKVIFVSGFQEFGYAKEAIRYGALDYLLKPIKKDDLLKTIEKSLQVDRSTDKNKNVLEDTNEGTILPSKIMSQLARDQVNNYHLIVFDFFLNQIESTSERRLKRFSISSLIEEMVENRKYGIFFNKGQQSILIVSNCESNGVKGIAIEMIQHIKEKGDYAVGAIISHEVKTMSAIPEAYKYCLDRLSNLFFADMMSVPVIVPGESVYIQHYEDEDLETYKQRTIEAIFSAQSEAWIEEFGQYAKIAGVMARGKKENAWFYLNSLIKEVGQRFDNMNIRQNDFDMALALKMGNQSTSYAQMKDQYRSFLASFRDRIRKAVETNEYSDIIKVKKYIDEHYAENVNLELLANQIHMNAYYFSSYFKKHAGENFKDYLNRVRMNAAMQLLLTTSMKSYEIAEEVGFKDHKYFSKIFQKRYGMTPSQYKKTLS